MLDLWELEHTPDAPVVSLDYVTLKGDTGTAMRYASWLTSGPGPWHTDVVDS